MVNISDEKDLKISELESERDMYRELAEHYQGKFEKIVKGLNDFSNTVKSVCDGIMDDVV